MVPVVSLHPFARVVDAANPDVGAAFKQALAAGVPLMEVCNWTIDDGTSLPANIQKRIDAYNVNKPKRVAPAPAAPAAAAPVKNGK